MCYEGQTTHQLPGQGQTTLGQTFVQLNAATKGLEGWPIPNILESLTET